MDLHPNWIGFQETKLSVVASSIIALDVGYAFSPSIERTTVLFIIGTLLAS